MIENALIFEMLQQVFEEWGKKIEASISAMMYTSMTRLCPKDIKKEITDVKEKLWKIYKIKR